MENNKRVHLTTVDNPYDPFTNFDEWYAFDISHGHNSCGLMAYFANVAQGQSDLDNDKDIEAAIDRVVEIDPLNQYVKVYEI